jgi:hypothetical protein
MEQNVKKSTDDCETIALGLYLITRKVEIKGQLRARKIECANPAYGFARLDEWEARERMFANAKSQALGGSLRRLKVKRIED